MFPCSTSTHLFVSQQVEAHYRKLHLAKSCIDNKTPHSLFTNPKAKGQRLRKRYLRPGAVDPRNENPQRPTPSTFHFEDPAVDEIVAGLLKSYKRRDFSLLYSQQNVRKNSNHLQTSSARSSSLNSLYKSRLPLRDPPADVLELHRSSFTEAKAYCPRTLKSAASSKLRTLDCYNPPKRRQSPDGLHVRNPSTKSQESSLQASDSSKKNANSPRISSELDLTPPASWLSADAQPREDTLRPPPLILEEIEYLNFLSAVTGEVIQKRQFSNK
uniref:C2H2-type domain-containing protein n=1 Tax=Mesocestoides corti TaxID=53468 RepID=A0A5K3FT38_MESCO